MKMLLLKIVHFYIIKIKGKFGFAENVAEMIFGGNARAFFFTITT